MRYRASALGVLVALIFTCIHPDRMVIASTAEVHSAGGTLALAGGAPPSLCHTGQQPSTVVITRTDAYRQPSVWSNTAPFKRTMADTARIRRLYDSICRLQPVLVLDHTHPIVNMCRSQGVVYHLGFWRDRQRLLLVSVDTGGCGVLFRGPIGVLGQRGTTRPPYDLYKSPFWCRLAQTMKVQEYDLFPHEKGDKPTAEEQACKITALRVDAQATPDGQTDRGTPSSATSLVE